MNKYGNKLNGQISKEETQNGQQIHLKTFGIPGHQKNAN